MDTSTTNRPLTLSGQLRGAMERLKEKEIYELNAQRAWSDYAFARLIDALHEYWIGYRFWNDVKSVIPLCDARHVLDVGCGVVSILNVIRREYPELDLTGVDPLMDEYQRLYTLNSTIAWRRAQLESLDFAHGEFDVVACTNALDHVEDVGIALQEIKRVIAPCGTLLLTVDVFASSVERNEGHPYSFTKKDLTSLLERQRFDIIWQRLSRHKIGMMNYANERIRRDKSQSAIRFRRGGREQLRSYVKQLVGRGALGELVLVARSY